jgi:N,N'-diacetyllegionaminate synthase
MASRTFVIAEVGQAHDGSLGILHSYIDALAKTGVDAIKFQTHIADAESSPHEPFRVAFSYQDATRQDYWRRMEFSAEAWAGIKQHCESAGVEFMSTPSCVAAVEMLERLGVQRYKVGSGDTDNHLLLGSICRTGKPMILSTGLSTLEQIDEAVGFISEFGRELVVMQCTSEYPAPPERIGLNQIPIFLQRYKRPVGLSDHSGTIYPSLAAVALGATYVETHAVFDRRMFGPDSPASLTIDETAAMVNGIRVIEASLHSSFDKTPTADQIVVREMFGKSLCVRRNMSAGETLQTGDLESKKPAGQGVPASQCERVVGKRLQRNLSQWDFIREDDVR